MTKKSIFQAGFEESLNLEKDGFGQLQHAQHQKTARHFHQGRASWGFRIGSFLLALVFAVGLNFMLLVISIALHADARTLKMPIAESSFLTAEVFLIGLFVWLLLIIIGKIGIRQHYLLPYRYNFHVFTTLIWFMLELDLLFADFLLPALSWWGVIAICILLIVVAWRMLNAKLKYLRQLLHGEMAAPALQDKIARIIVNYGAILLFAGLLAKMIAGDSAAEVSNSIKAFGFLLAWVMLNIASMAAVIFTGLPYFLQAYYHWKYPEAYRQRAGKSPQDWYGKRFVRQRGELSENGST